MGTGSEDVIHRIAKFFARNRDNRWVGRVDRRLLIVHEGYENLNYDMRMNGELRVLTKLAKTGSVTVVFDVGANRGDWTDLAKKTIPGIQIHAFEIIPETFGHLQKRFGNATNILINDIGLSDTEGSLSAYFSSERHEIATCVAAFSEGFHQYQPEVRSVSVTTGDRYCLAKGIEAIDFLKIDVEGFEPQVLRGFNTMLNSRQIEVIQFEYGYINIVTLFLLKDFYDFFSGFQYDNRKDLS